MAKALVFGTKDCAFESHRGRYIQFFLFEIIIGVFSSDLPEMFSSLLPGLFIVLSHIVLGLRDQGTESQRKCQLVIIYRLYFVSNPCPYLIPLLCEMELKQSNAILVYLTSGRRAVLPFDMYNSRDGAAPRPPAGLMPNLAPLHHHIYRH